MLVIENSGEVTICEELDYLEDYVMADMVFIPISEVYEIMELEDTT